MRPPLPNINDLAKGRWRDILPALGVDAQFLTGKHGPCPICNAGKDRWRFTNHADQGGWVCNQCGKGSGVDLVMKVNGWEFKEAAKAIRKALGESGPSEIRVRNGPDVEQVKAEMTSIWKRARPTADIKAATLYWVTRGLKPPATDDVRATDQLTYPGRREVFCGVLSKVRDAQGRWVNMHRTFIGKDGFKADLPEARMVMALPLPKGSHVRLMSVSEDAKVMGVAEGIETAASAAELFGLPVWAALNAENLKGFEPPEGIERLIVFGDNDLSCTGQEAAFALARKVIAKGRKADVKIPEAEGWDWNDVLVSKMEREPA